MANRGYNDSEFFADESTMTVVRRRKRFTLAQANRTLPLVRRIVADVVRTHGEACSLHKQLETRQPRAARDEIERQLNDVVERLQDFVDELNTIGCDLKDYRAGLIDFVAGHEGRDIYLCWKLGEEQILYWHEIEEGFAGRRPVELLGE